MMNMSSVLDGSHGIKYNNIYIKRGDYSELHITDGRNVDYIVIIDTCMIGKMIGHFWTISFVGKDGYKKPAIFSCLNRTKKIRLNRYELGLAEDNKDVRKIIFINRDPFDYRACNLKAVAKDDHTELRDRNKHNILGMNNIHELKYKGNLVAYQVIYKIDGKAHSKSFSISKLGKDNALIQAKQFRDANIA